ncbi:MAG: 6-hydroxycyclohex-1-ene-1-carbonyl-CoA dehydrogenase [Arenicellales bacterium]|nr:6-hydroxycyclohex-1-ene-1-carbonyl-CoA dehydrogenase [Arenicellales bacterium]
MNSTPHSWMMNAPGEALVKSELEPFSPGPGEVTVKVAGCGVCHTDLGYFYDGVRTTHPLPLVLGHEISGYVTATGEGSASWQDKAVVIPAVIPCGNCDLCRRGRQTICRNQKMPGNDIHGGFATHVTVPANGLCEVNEQRLSAAGLDLADVSVLADAVTTPYLAALQAEVQPGDLAIVVGVGGIGVYAVQIAYAMGASVIAIDIDPAKLVQLHDYGAKLTINGNEIQGRELKKAVQEFAKDNNLPPNEWKIFECSGTPAGQQTAYGLLTFGATLAVVGFTMDKVEIRLSNLMAFHARALGNWGCPPQYYPQALDLALDGKISMKPFIETHPLAEINAVFEAAHAHKLTKRAIMIPES